MSRQRESMEILVPNSPGENWRVHLARMERLSPLQPFAPELINFVESVSREILSDARMRALPEMVALAYWFRKAHVMKISERFCRQDDNRVSLPRGIVLHFAPANVDTIFVYSWLLSLLAGNLNIVRVSTGRGEQAAMLLEALNRCLATTAFAAIQERTLVICYEHDEDVTTELCSRCQVRVIWGGDETIKRLRQIPLPPLATELAFADRFSFAVLNARAVLLENDEGFGRLVRNFFADSFSLDQMACSSPRLVAWIGNASDVADAQSRFWPALAQYVAARQVQYPAVVGMTRLTAMYAYAAQGAVETVSTPSLDLPARAHLTTSPGNFREAHCGAGLFLEREFDQLRDLLPFVDAKDQTMAVFGFEACELQPFARELPNRGIDRIVSIGKSLTFSPVWDGIDLLQAFSREVEIDL